MNHLGLIALGISLVFAADAAASDKSKETPKELRGVWMFDQVFIGGEPLDHGGELTGDTVEFVDGKWIETSTSSDGTKSVRKERVEIDPTKSPKQINTYFLSNTVHEDSWPAIYVVKGNTLTICIGDERPMEFSSQNARLIVFKKQPDPNSSPQRDVMPRRRPRLLASNLVRRISR